MMKNIKNRAAFSMLELVFVIVILGIVSSIGAELIAKVYENYIVQRAQHRASIKTQLAINQITNRLRYAIPGTIIRRVGKTGAFEFATESMLINPSGDNYTVLQWVASDGDSFEAITSNTSSGTARRPGWSGFCDINASTRTIISTPGSNLDLTNTIQNNLGQAGGRNFAIFFPNDNNATGEPIAHYGTGTGQTITLDNNATRIVERYKLAWTSYALVIEDDNGDGNDDLVLYYNFLPTVGATIGNNKSLLLNNITNFKFESRGQTTRIKICAEENIAQDVTIPSCKEKAVF